MLRRYGSKGVLWPGIYTVGFCYGGNTLKRFRGPVDVALGRAAAVAVVLLLVWGLFLLMGINRSVPGVRALQVERLAVDSPRRLWLSLDGELDGNIPGQFEMVAGVLRVIVPRRS